jgi:molecular chaperone DnaJ
MSKDYYTILGVEKNASRDDIKSAYKKLAKKYHPDVNKEAGATEKFKEINEAASVLADEEKRRQYDQYGSDFTQRGSSGFDPSAFRDFSFDNIDDIFESFFGGGFRRNNQRPRGSDLRYDLEISLEEAAEGVTKTISLEKNTICKQCQGKGGFDFSTCKECHGTGQLRRQTRTPFGIFQTTTPCTTCMGKGEIPSKRCKECDGEGIVEDRKELEVGIPKGVDSDARLRIQGEGEGIKAGIPGDLYIFISIRKHPSFERRNDDLYVNIKISFAEAVMGTEIEVPTIDGKALLKIPAGTQPGTLMSMKGKGMPHLHNPGRGNQLVKVIVEVPTKLNKKQIELIKSFDEEIKTKKSFLERVFRS